MVIMLGITAINEPAPAGVIGLCAIMARVLYGLGYCNGGPKGRVIGAILWDICLLAVAVTAFISIFNWEEEHHGPTRLLPISATRY